MAEFVHAGSVRALALPTECMQVLRSLLSRPNPVRYATGILALGALLSPAFAATAVRAQSPLSASGRAEVFVGSRLENYLRVLQLAGESKPYPWSIRSLSPAEVDRLAPRDSAHPWAGRYDLQVRPERHASFELVRPTTRMIYNSAFAYGANDGAVWAGRGLTSSIQAGFAARYGPVSLTVAPIAFRAENEAFELADNGETGPPSYGDGRFLETIDLPQRFGDGGYQRVDPGQSTLRVDLAGLAVGVSTADQHWGPAMTHPIILGNNAGGFPHAFLGTSRPVDLRVGTVHGRIVWGELAQSAYSDVQAADSARRFMSGLVMVATIRGVPGLELGVGRFFHTPWAEGESLDLDHFLKPLEGLLKKGLADRDTIGDDTKQDSDNQLASIFGRWIFPESGFEIYGEYGRDDHNWNKRDLILLPDHMSAYTIGLSKLWRRSESEWLVLRGETFNSRRSHIHRVRSQAPFGVHAFTRQGHTLRGQMLGSAASFGGGGSVLALDLYRTRGLVSLEWNRTQRGDNDSYFLHRIIDPRGLDVMHSLGVSSVLFSGRWELEAGVTGVYDLNRNFGEDVMNLNLAVGARIGL